MAPVSAITSSPAALSSAWIAAIVASSAELRTFAIIS
jgi:hypothetical protein